jgi:hypothetical protein
MKKPRTKTPDGHSGRHSSEEATAGTVDLVALRQQITALVGNDAVRMVAETIEQVHQGHYQALKYLFEMVGLYPATAPQGTPGADSLAATLLNYLGVAEPAKRPEVTRLSSDGGVPPGEGAVK